MSTGETNGGRRLAKKKYRNTHSTTSENDPMKDRRCSKTATDCLRLTLWNSPFSKSGDSSTNVRRNCEKFLITRQDDKGTSAPFFQSRGRCPLPSCSCVPDYVKSAHHHFSFYCRMTCIRIFAISIGPYELQASYFNFGSDDKKYYLKF